jgi:hypothetical protein
MLKVELESNWRFHSADGGATTYVDKELKPISVGRERQVVRTGDQGSRDSWVSASVR